MNSFKKHQPIFVKTWRGGEWQRGWYLEENGREEHDVVLSAGTRTTVLDECIRADDQLHKLDGYLLIFCNRRGDISCVRSEENRIAFMRDCWGKDSSAMKLIAAVPLEPFNITFTEGQGLHPQQS